MAYANRLSSPVSISRSPFFVVAFFTGMRAGEMSALKWKNVDFDRRVIKVVETRVYGEEGRPKTNSSYRDIDMLPMVYDPSGWEWSPTGRSPWHLYCGGTRRSSPAFLHDREAVASCVGG